MVVRSSTNPILSYEESITGEIDVTLISAEGTPLILQEFSILPDYTQTPASELRRSYARSACVILLNSPFVWSITLSTIPSFLSFASSSCTLGPALSPSESSE